MIETAEWDRIRVDVISELRLDPRNVRLSGANYATDADIMADLFANEGALSLVQGIAQLGYFTHETPVVVRGDDVWIVAEGNRRVAALKAIQNPNLVPAHASEVEGAAPPQEARPALREIEVLVAPDRDAANELIAALHTSNLRRPWKPARQAAFFKAQIDAGRTLEDLVARYPTLGVRGFVFGAQVIETFESIPYDDPALRRFLQTKKWQSSFSTLERLYQSRAFQDVFGFTLDKAGVLRTGLSDELLKELATVVVEGIRDGDLTTRTLNTTDAERFVLLMATLQSIREAGGSSAAQDGSLNPESHAAEGDEQEATQGDRSVASTDGSHLSGSSIQEDGSGAGSDAPARRAKPRYLKLPMPPQAFPEGLLALYTELRDLDVRKYPNTAFMGMRALLERTIKAYAELSDRDIHQDNGKSRSNHVMLEDCTLWLLNRLKEDPSPTAKPLVRVAEKLRQHRIVTYFMTAEGLNSINHNHHFYVEPDEIIPMWGSMRSLIEYMVGPG